MQIYRVSNKSRNSLITFKNMIENTPNCTNIFGKNMLLFYVFTDWMAITGFSAEVRSTTFAKAYIIELHTSRTLFTKTNDEIRVSKKFYPTNIKYTVLMFEVWQIGKIHKTPQIKENVAKCI